MNRTEEREILKDSGGSQEEINALTTVIHDIDEVNNAIIILYTPDD